MTTPHDPSHEERVRSVFLGELSADDPAVAELADCPRCRAELAGLEAVVGKLDATAAAEREELRAAEDVEGPDVHETLRRIAAAEPHAEDGAPTPRRWLLVAVVAAVAAAVLAFVVGPRLVRDDGEGPPLYIGDGQGPVLTSPKGEVEAYGTFEWLYDRDHEYGFRIRIYDADVPAGALPVFEEPYRMETTWTPTDEQSAAFPDRIQWEVDALDASGEPFETSEPLDAWRRSD